MLACHLFFSFFCSNEPIDLASSSDKVELVTPPEGATLGERVTFEGYPLDLHPPILNPKQQIFDKVKQVFKKNNIFQEKLIPGF